MDSMVLEFIQIVMIERAGHGPRNRLHVLLNLTDQVYKR